METEQVQIEDQPNELEHENIEEEAGNEDMLNNMFDPGMNIGNIVQHNWGEGHVLDSTGQVSNPEQTPLQRAGK